MFIKDKENPLHITMVEGDYGITLSIRLVTEEGEEITQNTSFDINIFKTKDNLPIVSKTYSNIQNKTIEFSLTEEESLLLPKGNYIYDLDWYEDGVFMNNIVRKESYSVIDKGKKVSVADES